MNADAVAALIREAMPDARIEVRGDDGVHFEALVVSERFEGQATLQRHRTVYAALGELMGREIHAMSLQTLTPAELDAG
ncbi:MAG: BolA/IbaG family iron-sulfur metabolism protein [Gammaproteobacteria bacterium]|nr:BolA/IbaG family iron-sulfur metabolism protein [Gammaproteobacteria bacterium]NND59574.1 BolA/IbaG family iron-sulfur metabolism protein [Gammaproteobacteria bacterium]